MEASANPDPRAMSIPLDGRHLEAAWWGPGPEAAATIVLLHQGLGSVSLWQDVPARIAAATGCGVLAWSRFGYGWSDGVPLPWPLTYLHDEAIRVLPRMLDAAGVRRAILLGHSDGGSIAVIHAGTHGDPRLRGLVLLAPHVVVEEITLAGVRAARERWDDGGLRERLARHHRDPEAAFLGWNGAWSDPGFAAGFDLRPELARIRVPMLVVQGEADPYGTTEQVRVIERHAVAPVEALLLPGIGHSPLDEAPAVVLGAVTTFAARIFGNR
jgi:pimeloyl-ACP methyl ester carboxylesterase